MGSRPFRAHLRLLVILYLALIIGGAGASPGPGVNLERSDSDALRQFMKDLGVNGQHISRLTDPNPCQWAGISCERRIFVGLPVARVTRIRLGSRRLTGFLSSVIGGLSELKELSLPNNHLFDQIPHQIGECRKLEILNLGNNELSGKVPSQITSLIRLRVLDLSYNRISGDLRFLNHFPNLENLSLSDNLFEGKIPLSLKSFRNLRFLNLSNNHLHYPEPLERIENLDILSLPKRHRLAENSTRSRRNNTSALSPTSPVSGNGSTSAAAPPPSNSTRQHHNKMKKHHKHLKSTILGFFVGLFAGVLSGAVLSLLFRSLLSCIRGRGKTSGPEIFSPLIKNAEDLAFLEKEDGLSSLEVIGRGGCGEVYKAELPGSGGAKHIAIKKIVQPAMDGADLTEEDSRLLNKRMRQIRSEIQTVGHIRHRNLLPLVAHVCRPDCHFLVYEFMNNGSLQDALTQVKEGTRDLDWLTRHKIAMGIAAGLEYLHKSHSPRIIHRDLKPANILLDDDMEARIADFGLAKAVPEAYTHVTTSNLAGTVGYIAPEYHQTLKFTDKCDIYSFGVVLATLVMGRLPSDDFFQNTEEMSLVKWMKNVMASDDPCRAIDPKLLGKGFEEEMLLVLKIACFCTNEEGKQRPDSKDVRCMLSQVKK